MSNVSKPISNRISDSWSDFVKAYDLGALPAFVVFLVVVTLGMLLNFLTMRNAIGDGPAALVSGLFEFSILGWKWQSNRKRNNDTQNQIITWATWTSVFLSVAMLVINLFRATIENSLSVDVTAGVNLNGWEIAAYATIGLAALADVVYYLLFDQNDTDKEYERENKRKENDIRQRGRRAEDTIKNTESDLKIIEKITVELAKMADMYKALPREQLEIVIENARLELLSQYQASPLVAAATSGLADLNKDNKIGDKPIPAPLPDLPGLDLEALLKKLTEAQNPNGKQPTADPTDRPRP